MSIFSQLPNDILMRIIKEGDGGRNTHKKKMKKVLENLLKKGGLDSCDERANDENLWYISTLSGGYLYVPMVEEDWERDITKHLDETMYEKHKSIAQTGDPLRLLPNNTDASWLCRESWFGEGVCGTSVIFK